MTATIAKTDVNALVSIVENEISEDWQNNYFRLQQTSDATIILAKRVQSNIIGQSICATLVYGNEVIACGLCVVEGDYAGLYDIIVAPQHRQKGYGKDICLSLMCAASKFGAKTAYLQVVAENYRAISLYEKIGFKNMYQYSYRVKRPQSP